MTYPFLNFNGATEWISNSIPDFTGACDYLAMLGLKLSYASKKGPRGLFTKMAYLELGYRLKKITSKVFVAM